MTHSPSRTIAVNSERPSTLLRIRIGSPRYYYNHTSPCLSTSGRLLIYVMPILSASYVRHIDILSPSIQPTSEDMKVKHPRIPLTDDPEQCKECPRLISIFIASTFNDHSQVLNKRHLRWPLCTNPMESTIRTLPNNRMYAKFISFLFPLSPLPYLCHLFLFSSNNFRGD